VYPRTFSLYVCGDLEMIQIAWVCVHKYTNSSGISQCAALDLLRSNK